MQKLGITERRKRMKTTAHIIINIFFIVFATLPFETVTAADVNVVILGDSNSWLGGDNCDKPEGWTKWFKDELKPASCKSYARSGATWTNTRQTRRNVEEDIDVIGDDNVICNQINRLYLCVDNGTQPNPDIIVIAAGTNDVWFKSKRPAAFNKSASSITLKSMQQAAEKRPEEALTLADAVAQNCLRLKAIYPKAKLVLLTPMQTTKASDADIRKAGDIIEKCARLLGAGCVRLDIESKVKSDVERNIFTYTKDGTHTNKAGAEANGRLIARYIEQLHIGAK